MKIIYNRRDIGFTIISRFEELYRNYLSSVLSKCYNEFTDGIPQAIISKTNEKSAILYYDDIDDFFENTDFPDLLEITIYTKNEGLLPKDISKEDLIAKMKSLYGLRCKIAHVKGFFTSFDLDKLIELSKEVALVISKENDFLSLISELERNPETVAIKVPLDFNVDYLESNGIINNLPTPDYEYEGGFVGRDDDIREILKYLNREKFPVVTITGAGGVGKTSLALKVIQELTQKPQSSNFDAIIWMSAKENKLSPIGIEDIEPSLRSYEELLDTVINVLGFGINLQNESVEEKEEKVSILFEMSKSILIIIDNLETITDERIINFIIDAPQNAKFLITSRKGLGQVERRYELKQLKEKEAIYLFRQLAKDKQIDSLLKLDNSVIKKYVNKVSNYPLAIKWVIGQVARGRDINKIIDSIDDATGDISKFCFEQIFNLLNDKSKNILYSICCFDEPPPASLLKYVVEMSSQDFDDCIEELILVSLVIPEQYRNEQNEISRRFLILHLTKSYVRHQLNNNIALRENILKRISAVENTITTTEQAKREYRFSLHNLGATTEEEKIAAIFTQTAFQKYQAGLYEDAVENYKKAIGIAPRFSSVYRNWAVMESYENHLFEADKLIAKAAELNNQDPQIWLLWGNIKRKAKKIVEADEKYKKALELSKDDHIILNAYGQTRGRLGDYEKALELFSRALKTELNISSKKHEIINRTSIAEVLVYWSEYLFKDRDFEKAETKLFEALDNCNIALKIDSTDTKTQGVLAKIYYKIGKHYNKLRSIDEAIKFFNMLSAFENVSFNIVKYKIKGAIEISKIYYDRSDIMNVKNMLEPYLSGNDNIYRRYPELLSEINQILENTGNLHSLIGKIVHVNIVKEFVLIEDIKSTGKTYIAGKDDFIPVQNSLSYNLKDLEVKFIPKVFLSRGVEKQQAKNIILISRQTPSEQ